MLVHLMILLHMSVFSRQNVVSTAQGRVRGVAHNGYTAYTGIPYASITHEDRFKTAGIAPIWSSIRESKISTCSILSEVEECLQLDVYVPTVQGTSWPVLVWVSGGTGPFNPGHLVREEIIVVVVHHRIGPQGFLCFDEETIPGNAGVKDVLLALRWVRDNIVAFYGNPSKITAAGSSFGAAMLDAIILSSMGSGLFHGAILQSGTALCPWAFNYDAQERIMSLKGVQDSIDSLLDVEIDELVARSNELDVPYFPFAICSEKPLQNVERILRAAPYDLLISNKWKTVPMMIGYNSNEAYIFLSLLREAKVLRRISRTPGFLLPEDLRFLNDRERRQVARQVRNMYFKNRTMASILAYHRDAYFSSHIHRSVHHYSSVTPVFYYQFSYSGDVGVQSEPGVEKSGSAHSDELAYLFNELSLDGKDGVIQKRLVKLWTNFVKHLNPTPSQNEFLRTTWEVTKPEHTRLLDISSELKMVDYPHARSTPMWDDIYEKYYYTRNRIVH